MKQAVVLLKNWSLLNKRKWRKSCILAFALFPLLNLAQIANYVNNGSFEDHYPCTFQPSNFSIVKHWRTIDSLTGTVIYCDTCPQYSTVPYNNFGFQYPRTGHGCILYNFLCEPPSCSVNDNRSYARNRLRNNLNAGSTYCVKFYVNINNNSTYGVSNFAAYFGSDVIDTITKCTIPITYLVPQIQNQSNNIVTDTLNWTLITGTFVANGQEKHLIIGNFNSDAATNKLFFNPTNSPIIGTDVCIDDVSCIDVDLPAFAGHDTSCIPGNTIYLGRQRDVGIDEDCMWFKLPNLTTAIDTAAGIWISPTSTSTYVVRQDICGNVKWDTVIVYQDALGIQNLKFKVQSLELYPVPAQDELILQWNVEGLDKEYTKAEILNSLGQTLLQTDLNYDNRKAKIKVKDLQDGVYVLRLRSSTGILTKRFVVSR